MILDDVPELAELYRQFFNQPSHISRMTEILEILQTRNDYIFLVAVDGDKLVGSVMGIVCWHLYGCCYPFLVLQNFIVDQEHHRKGVASLLLAEIERRAIEKGCLWCDLISSASREAACGFYRDRGFSGFAEGTAGFRKTLR
jgi:ribosomal protein S18 acetylase RimI-like enzyme